MIGETNFIPQHFDGMVVESFQVLYFSPILRQEFFFDFKLFFQTERNNYRTSVTVNKIVEFGRFSENINLIQRGHLVVNNFL